MIINVERGAKNMPDIKELFRQFYKKYNYDVIKRAYGTINTALNLFNIYKFVPFEVEVRMKNDCLAMQINSENIVSAELMTVIGFFFENYSFQRNCVWTKDKSNIKNFFVSGIDEFRSYGGKITLNVESDGIQKIVHLMTDNAEKSDDALYLRLCDNFKQLENESWHDLYKKCVEEIETEKDNAHIEEVTSMDLPLDWSNAFSCDERASGVFAENAADGLVLSINNLGEVDIEYISQITGMNLKDVISELGGSIYQNPDRWEECFYKGWETADEYLSGRVLEKLKTAKEADKKYNGYFRNNVKALKAVIPQKISSDDIYITLGSPWVPTDVIDDFIKHLLGDFYAFRKEDKDAFKTQYDAENSVWKIPCKTRYKKQVKSSSTYGTDRIEALYIIEKTLNMRPVYVTDEVMSLTSKSGKKRVTNKQETMLATEKQQAIIKEFQNWIWQDEKRKKRLEKIYDDTYASSVIRHYDGSFLSFSGMSEKEKLFDYQKNAVARIMFSPNTLLAHDVGSGKTFVMIAAGMEMRRIGISKKNMYVVPNNIIGQWKDLFERLYPKANVLCIDPSCFSPKKREAVIEEIKNGDYDGIIIAYSCFETVPISKQYYIDTMMKEIEKLNKQMKNNKLIDKLQSKSRKLTEAVEELKNAADDICDTIYFEDLGINTLFVDEAHNYKNLPIETKISKVLGISTTGSAKCSDMYEKVRIVQKQNNGRGVVFATGTPITNSLTDAYVMQKYLQYGELTLLGLQNFDSWIGMFAEKVNEMEIDVDTSKFRMATRFSKFHNLPELGTLLASIADFHSVDKQNGIPDFDGYADDNVSKTDELQLYLDDISARADVIRSHGIDPKLDNMLKVTSDGRKAALDLRLVNPTAVFSYESKAAHCAENVMEIYKRTEKEKSAQLIFCDISTPKASFNLYDEMKQLLVKMGADEREIAFIHDAKTEKERNLLFASVQSGEIRILIGSTFKLGLGVNIQNKLCALHHLDVPWRPADMVQREGRIIRQGNENKKIEIYRYITEGSFDAYSWQILENKQRIISNVLSGNVDSRTCDEIDDAVLDYAEVKALAIGNPLLKERVECANELSRCVTLQRKLLEMRSALEIEKLEIPGKIKRQKELAERAKADSEFIGKNKFIYKNEERAKLREVLFGLLKENELCDSEHTALSYRGFDVILPAGMFKHKPFVYIKNNGRYRIELGLAKTGILTRIDNFMDNFEKHLAKIGENLEKLKKRKVDIAQELSKDESYSDKIQSLKDRIEEIDKRLGVKNE